LVSEIRYQAAMPFEEGRKWVMTDPNGTHLEGTVLPAVSPNHPWFSSYAVRREESGYYRPWPEWVHPPVNSADVNGEYVFEWMLSWWARYIGISPYFEKPIRLTIENNHIRKIEGGTEAEALKRFLDMMKERLGDSMYDCNAFHFGVHPLANVAPHQCPHPLHRRVIEHSHSCNLHIHIGVPESTWNSYPYMVHITGDIRKPTLKVGDTYVYDQGHLTAMDHPAVKAVADKYPGRPGVEPYPRSF
jgi:hypothetical protein